MVGVLAIVLKSKFQMRKATGDSNCLFYSLLRENNLQLALQIRHDLAGWIQAHPEHQMEGMYLELWVSHQFVRASQCRPTRKQEENWKFKPLQSSIRSRSICSRSMIVATLERPL